MEKERKGGCQRGHFHAGNVQNMLYISCCFTVSPLPHAHPHLCMCPPMCSLSLPMAHFTFTCALWGGHYISLLSPFFSTCLTLLPTSTLPPPPSQLSLTCHFTCLYIQLQALSPCMYITAYLEKEQNYTPCQLQLSIDNSQGYF